jgi:hypothetical protein
MWKKNQVSKSISKHKSFGMKMATGRPMLADPSTGIISTTCDQRVHTHILTRRHCNCVVNVWSKIVSVLNWSSTTLWRRMGERMYKSTFFLTSALVGEWVPVPVAQDAWWSRERVCSMWKRKYSWPYRDSNSYLSVCQRVGSRYTDWAFPTPAILEWRRLFIGSLYQLN